MRPLLEMTLGFSTWCLLLLGVQYGMLLSGDGHPSLAMQPPWEAALEAKNWIDQVISSSFAQNLFCSNSAQSTCGIR